MPHPTRLFSVLEFHNRRDLEIVRGVSGVEDDFRSARKAPPAFIVDDVRMLAATLRDHGYRVVEGQPLAGYDRVYVDDPFGNRLSREPKP